MPSAGLSIRWEQATRPAAIGGSTLEDMVRGADEWVGVSSCYGGRCPEVGDGVVVWTSSDGETWSASNVTRATGKEVAPRYLAAGAAGYLLTTDTYTEFPGPPNWLWSSPDGIAWQAIGEIPHTECTRKLCANQGSLAVTPSGTVLTHAFSQSEAKSFGPFASEDGVAWRLVEPSAFGLDNMVVDSIESTDAAVLLMGRSCWDCEPRLWTSADGTTWDHVEKVPVQLYSQPHFATGNGQRVVVLTVCSAAHVCGGTEIWSSTDGGPWTRRISNPDIYGAAVGFTGSAFVAVGLDEGCRYEGGRTCGITPARYVVFGSADGMAWSEVPNDSGMNPADEDCSPAWVVGANGTVLLGGESECINWLGTVTVP
jgi:hypothetical protein